MALEIERKFKVSVKDFKALSTTHKVLVIDQGYLILQDAFHSRVRVSMAEGVAEATFCSKVGTGMIREEYEEKISLDHAKVLLSKSLKIVRKQRLKIHHEGLIWDVDYFVDHDLAVAEVEIPHKDYEILKPDWAGKEVTNDKAYSNIRLAKEIRSVRTVCNHPHVVKDRRSDGASCQDCKESLGWYCETSPTKTCQYDEENDPACDSCIYCGDPDERK